VWSPGMRRAVSIEVVDMTLMLDFERGVGVGVSEGDSLERLLVVGVDGEGRYSKRFRLRGVGGLSLVRKTVILASSNSCVAESSERTDSVSERMSLAILIDESGGHATTIVSSLVIPPLMSSADSTLIFGDHSETEVASVD
jgi:hypothetical protein